MSSRIKLILQIVAVAAIFTLVVFICMYVWFLASANPLQNTIARRIPWPVTCTSRGCITVTRWNTQHQLASAFAEKTKQSPPTPAESLTTVIRAHLVEHGFLRAPLTIAGAKKYREEVLQLKDNSQLQQATSASLDIYDKYVVLPFLQQEALRQQKSVESTEELYSQLSKERYVLLLPFKFRWDKDRGAVVQR